MFGAFIGANSPNGKLKVLFGMKVLLTTVSISLHFLSERHTAWHSLSLCLLDAVMSAALFLYAVADAL